MKRTSPSFEAATFQVSFFGSENVSDSEVEFAIKNVAMRMTATPSLFVLAFSLVPYWTSFKKRIEFDYWKCSLSHVGTALAQGG